MDKFDAVFATPVVIENQRLRAKEAELEAEIRRLLTRESVLEEQVQTLTEENAVLRKRDDDTDYELSVLHETMAEQQLRLEDYEKAEQEYVEDRRGINDEHRQMMAIIRDLRNQVAQMDEMRDGNM